MIIETHIFHGTVIVYVEDQVNSSHQICGDCPIMSESVGAFDSDRNSTLELLSANHFFASHEVSEEELS